jgi:hypothetical protein
MMIHHNLQLVTTSVSDFIIPSIFNEALTGYLKANDMEQQSFESPSIPLSQSSGIFRDKVIECEESMKEGTVTLLELSMCYLL